jgi:hypothetical protein
MKTYTDLNQSKKLAEILPLESADMYYFTIIRNYPYSQGKIKVITKIMDGSFSSDYDIPCWSSAALFEAIPQEIFDGKYIINITEGRDNKWILTYDYYENRYHSYYSLSTDADNLVDACYEMIIKLKEMNLI